MEQIHEPGNIPRRMAPLILATTLVTHLFGGSAGREGTAVQMDGTIASTFGRLLRLNATTYRSSHGWHACRFGAVFGAPLAGAVFAMEVLSVDRMITKR